MPVTVGQEAVVIGAGMGGLAAAKAVTPYFERVVVLDRDALPDAPAPRVGTPQARHAHALLASGERALEKLFPGIGGDFIKAGAVTVRLDRDIVVERPGYDPFPRRDLGFDLISASRPAIEHVSRRRLEQNPKVEIRSRARVAELIPSRDGRGVAGVRYEDDSGAVQELAADLVVDASGRALPTLSFLEGIGIPKPELIEIGCDVGYASAIFEPPNEARDWLGVVHFGAPPDKGNGGLILPIEEGRWLVSLSRRPSGEMPAEIESFAAFTETFRTRTVYQALRTAKPLTDVARFRFSGSVRRHFHKLEDWPRGLIPIGDSICRFNPLFGQGMSVAALEASALGKLIAARAQSADPLAGLGHDFLVQIQELLEAPWAVAVSDFAYAHATGDPPPDLAQRLLYAQAILRLAAEDADMHKLMVEVAQLLKSPGALREPAIRERAMALMATAA
jgi:2-polyprenyl-6-methoxyphenol hydroxylase-like FAD-dependent oxidoreductase